MDKKKRKRWFGKNSKPESQGEGSTSQDIERRAKRAENRARQTVEKDVKDKVNEIVQQGLDPQVRDLISAISNAINRAKVPSIVTMAALTIMQQSFVKQYSNAIFQAEEKRPSPIQKSGSTARLDISQLPPEVQAQIRKKLEDAGQPPPSEE